MERKWLFRVLRYGLGLLIALLIFWGFYGFVKDDNWLAVSALATLVLALGAFLTIRQNHLLQKRERRDRLLNEIIEWAIKITKHRFEESLKELLQITDSSGTISYKKSLQFVHADIVEAKEIFASLGIQSQYVSKTAFSFGVELHSAVKDLAGKIDEYVNYLDNWQNTLFCEIEKQKKDVDIVRGASKADEIGRRMDKSAQKILEEAAKIKTKDIN